MARARTGVLPAAAVTALLAEGHALLVEGDRPQALACFRRAAADGSVLALFDLATALMDDDRWGEARTAFAQAAAGAPEWARRRASADARSTAAAAARPTADRPAPAPAALPVPAAVAVPAVPVPPPTRNPAPVPEPVAVPLPAAVADALLPVPRSAAVPAELRLRGEADADPAARAALGRLLHSSGRPAEARRVLERGTALDERDSWLPLGNLLLDGYDDPIAAAAAYRGGIAAGDVMCHSALGLLLQDLGDTRGAAEEFRRGAGAVPAPAATRTTAPAAPRVPTAG